MAAAEFSNGGVLHSEQGTVRRIRIDREKEAIHDLMLSVDEPVGIWRDLYI
jgi:hypothetical protein